MAQQALSQDQQTLAQVAKILEQTLEPIAEVRKPGRSNIARLILRSYMTAPLCSREEPAGTNCTSVRILSLHAEYTSTSKRVRRSESAGRHSVQKSCFSSLGSGNAALPLRARICRGTVRVVFCRKKTSLAQFLNKIATQSNPASFH